MTKLITILILVAVCFVGWRLFVHWEKVKREEATQHKDAETAASRLQNLPGLPHQLEDSLRLAQNKGERTLGEWLKNYGHLVQDPRKAWIELDYCQLRVRSNPAEARQLFAAVRDRTPPASPVWPRIKELEKSFH